RLGNRLGALALRRDDVVGVRGAGLLWGVELSKPAGEVVARALEAGLLLCTAGPSVVRIVPPLVANDEELDRGLSLLDEVL
ncbi:MAG: aminotransferase class III-fold pyridoxal phosphate-dependent enzyme, partial [Gemmatimonadota bacterium]|nr:aminotransferase class III-fold pyridoxal phosphate-dependent enzyme [Gemmatimonadota bacterium]